MTIPRKYSSALSVIAVSLLLCVTPLAQSAGQQATGQTGAVKVSVLVVDKEGQPVTDLRREDFQVFVGDEPQTVSFFSNEEVPVSYGLLIDSSRSLESQFPAIIEAGKLIIHGNRGSDEAFLVRFVSTEKIELSQDFTSDKPTLLGQFDSFRTEMGQTAVLDALYTAADHLRKRSAAEDFTRRRALILVSDGEDRNSSYREGEVLELLRKSNIQVFAIGLVGKLEKDGGLTRRDSRGKAVALLERLAKETGGRAFITESSSEVREAALRIAAHLRSQYVIGYNPSAGKAVKDASRKTRVKLADAPGRDKFKVMARAAYAAP